MGSSGYIEFDDEEAWRRLGELVARRRQELGLSHREAARLSESGPATWSIIENAKLPAGRLQRNTARKLESTLQWTPGSLESALKSGHKPVALENSPTLSYVNESLQNLIEIVEDLVERVDDLEKFRPAIERIDKMLKVR